jgi:mannose-1-phosphate guanylyltransferase
MSFSIVAVIMAGGAGTRFWPLSTETRPKQFLPLVGSSSPLQLSFQRLEGLCPADRVLVVTSHNYVDMCREQLPEVPPDQIVGEPIRRDTAAAVAWAALLCQAKFGPCTMVMLTADHWIDPISEFQLAVKEMLRGVDERGGLYTMGIRPTWPSTGYGYLQTGESCAPSGAALPHHRVTRFKEKPNATTASEYLRAGNFLWNSGMFAWTCATILEAFRNFLPAHLDRLEPAIGGSPEDLLAAFQAIKPISVDYAIMERAPKVSCVVPHFAWSDLGGWQALAPFLESDAQGNLSRGRLAAYQSRNNLLFNEDDEEQVALLGVQDLIIVRAGKKTLVVAKDRAEEVKQLLELYPYLNARIVHPKEA